MKSEIDQILAEKKFLRRLYELIDEMKLSTAYEGRIEKLGDAVMRWDNREIVYVDKSIIISDDLSITLRSFLGEVKWKNINFICPTIVDHHLIWGES